MTPQMKNNRSITQRQKQQHERVLFTSILALQSVEECSNFFRDLCTPNELRAMADRWAVPEPLEHGLSSLAPLSRRIAPRGFCSARSRLLPLGTLFCAVPWRSHNAHFLLQYSRTEIARALEECLGHLEALRDQ